MGNVIQKSPVSAGVAVGGNSDAGKLALVKKVIFPDATPDEMELYLYKCSVSGVNPLDRKIYPIKYGGRLTFVASIDYMRSKAAASGVFDGVSDVEYMGDEDADHPDEAVVCVYRKDVSRPFVGRARWTEYSGGNAQWKSKPYLMLAKCAEAQAYRKAFPDDLAQLYDAAELDVAVDDSRSAKSTKPRITAADVAVAEKLPLGAEVTEATVAVPENALHGVVEKAETKSGEKNGKPWTLYEVTIDGTVYGTFDAKMGKRADVLIGQEAVFTAESRDGRNKLTSIADAAE